MKIVFISNFLNHHQLPFCIEMINKIGLGNFKFIATEKIPEERINLGYEDMNSKYDFVFKYYENSSECLKIVDNADVIIYGDIPSKILFYLSFKCRNKIIFKYSERIFKNDKVNIRSLLSLFIKTNFLERKFYVLCSSAFLPYDYSRVTKTKNMYKWGYFPEVKEYTSLKKVISSKNKNSIVWVARYLDWKHPEIPVEIAKRLKEDNIDFELNMIGTGELLESIKNLVEKNKLQNNVHILGSMSPEKVREYMESSEYFLFTSDRGEGWGAVLNEALNSCCVTFSNSEIGSVPFLINDGINGFIYEDGNIDDLYLKFKKCIIKEISIKTIQQCSYETVSEVWNAKIAVNNLMLLVKSLYNKKNIIIKNGPCSKAEILKDNWYSKKNS